MAVSLVPKFKKADIQKALQERKEKLIAAIIMRFRRIGEQFVANARENGNYKDRTGNLRSSIGYVILQDGVQLYQDYKSMPGPDGKKKGKSAGVANAKRVIDEVKAKFPRGFVLICVAGMDYAAAVESKGFDVLTASSKTAELELKKAVEAIQSKVFKQ